MERVFYFFSDNNKNNNDNDNNNSEELKQFVLYVLVHFKLKYSTVKMGTMFRRS